MLSSVGCLEAVTFPDCVACQSRTRTAEMPTFLCFLAIVHSMRRFSPDKGMSRQVSCSVQDLMERLAAPVAHAMSLPSPEFSGRWCGGEYTCRAYGRKP